MKLRPILVASFSLLCIAPAALLAEDYEFHPSLSDNFTAALGAMRSSNSFKFSALAIGIDPEFGDEIDFGDDLGVSNSSTFFNGQLRWKFGNERKWSVWGQYFSNKATGNATLEEDIEWEDVIFKEGTYAEAGAKLEVIRVFVGRSFVKSAQHDFGAGIGIHNLDLSVYLEGEIKVNDEPGIRRRYDNGISQILPNIGGWYNFSPARNWLIHSRVDWLSAHIGDYDGGLWNASVGLNYQAFRHVGFDLSWQYFNLHVDVDKTDWVGSANMTYSGPVISASFAW
jgi:hypothetical protein